MRALPWVKVEKSYTFTSPEGDLMLGDLFNQDNQLLIKHFMMEPEQEWQGQCCSLESDHVDGLSLRTSRLGAVSRNRTLLELQYD
jgi:predicted dithiol-disulfide oxidoreductase (DUF899 family)